MCFAGSDGGGGPVYRPSRRQEVAEAAGNNLRWEAWQTEQRQDEGAQSGEREQEPGLPAH